MNIKIPKSPGKGKDKRNLFSQTGKKNPALSFGGEGEEGGSKIFLKEKKSNRI